MFATHILKGDDLDRRHDAALPDRQPVPGPDLRMCQRPIGPVAVFGASDFPLAFSTAGGDTAAALLAGCPVVVKPRSAHPGTSEIVADAIKAVAFRGSLGGRGSLIDLCAARPEPIPFFGELGSVNPKFIFAGALANRGSAIAQGWAGSLTMAAGQFCTNPGVAVMLAGPNADAFAEAYRAGQRRMGAATGVRELLSTTCDQRSAAPSLYATTAKAWLANEELAKEVFRPLGMIVTADSAEEMLAIARNLQGQLTCTVHVDAEDTAATRFMLVPERKAGRLLANGFPTGVEVSDTMVHGGPYPASTNFGATSVGTMFLRRFLRPVGYQDMPEDLLPADL